MYFVLFTDWKKINTCTGYKSVALDVINFSQNKNKYPTPKNTMYMCIIRYRVFIFIMRKLYNVRWVWYTCIYFVLFTDIFFNFKHVHQKKIYNLCDVLFCKLQKFNHALNVKNTLKYFQKLLNLVILKLQWVDS